MYKATMRNIVQESLEKQPLKLQIVARHQLCHLARRPRLTSCLTL